MLFFVFCRFTQLDGTPYGSNVTAPRSLGPGFLEGRSTGSSLSPNDVVNYWQFMRDVGVMIFIGFGFLMTFLKRHRFSAIGYTMFISVIIVEWNILVTGFYTYVLSRGTGNEATQISVGFPQMILGLFCAGSALNLYQIPSKNFFFSFFFAQVLFLLLLVCGSGKLVLSSCCSWV